MLLYFGQMGSPVEDITSSAAQPVIICTGRRGNLAQAFVAVEGQVTICPSLLSAVDRAFKLHYIVDIAYTSQAEHVWQLLQKGVFSIHDHTATFASVSELIAFLKRFK